MQYYDELIADEFADFIKAKNTFWQAEKLMSETIDALLKKVNALPKSDDTNYQIGLQQLNGMQAAYDSLKSKYGQFALAIDYAKSGYSRFARVQSENEK